VTAPEAGLTLYERSSPFFDLIGPLLAHRGETGIQFALSIDERHVNAQGSVHAGVLAALADVALGYRGAGARSSGPPDHGQPDDRLRGRGERG
jgi:acyl-coenzyme A thioesterase 13